MMDILTTSVDLLSDAGYASERLPVDGHDVLVFEDATIVGFLVPFASPGHAIAQWDKIVTSAVAMKQFGLRRAGKKAWNTYAVLLSSESPNDAQVVALSAIEEDLSETRKIARAGITDLPSLRAALLTLLPLQSAPQLEAVDLPSEIRQRATELPPPVIDAFLSATDCAVTIQVLEEAP